MGLWLEGLHIMHFGFRADILGFVGQGTQVSLSPLSPWFLMGLSVSLADFSSSTLLNLGINIS